MIIIVFHHLSIFLQQFKKMGFHMAWDSPCPRRPRPTARICSAASRVKWGPRSQTSSDHRIIPKGRKEKPQPDSHSWNSWPSWSWNLLKFRVKHLETQLEQKLKFRNRQNRKYPGLRDRAVKSTVKMASPNQPTIDKFEVDLFLASLDKICRSIKNTLQSQRRLRGLPSDILSPSLGVRRVTSRSSLC